MKNIAKEKFEYPRNLQSYIDYIPNNAVSFNKESFTYSFNSLLRDPLPVNDIHHCISNDQVFKKKSYREQNELQQSLDNLLADIATNSGKIENLVVCPYCGSVYRYSNLSYMECNCGYVLDFTGESIRLYNSEKEKDSKLKLISDKDWGMDYISFNL